MNNFLFYLISILILFYLGACCYNPNPNNDYMLLTDTKTSIVNYNSEVKSSSLDDYKLFDYGFISAYDTVKTDTMIMYISYEIIYVGSNKFELNLIPKAYAGQPCDKDGEAGFNTLW